MAIEAVKQEAIANKREISAVFFKEAQFIAPIAISETALTATETVLHLRPIQNAYEKDQTWYEINIYTHRDDRWMQCFRAEVQTQHEESSKTLVDGGKETRLWQEKVRERLQQANDSSKKTFSKTAFYKFCEDQGYQYGKSFQLLQDIWDLKDH